MSSAEDLESATAADPHDRSPTRAADRAERPGLDVDPDLVARAAAAARAFAALRRTAVPSTATGDPGADEPGDAPDPGGAPDPSGAPDAVGDRAGDHPALDAPADGWGRNGRLPLRPDAVLRHRRLAGNGLNGSRPADQFDVDPEGPVHVSPPPATPPVAPPPPATGARPAAPPHPAASSAPAHTSGHAPGIDRYLLDVGAVAIAAGAFVSPLAWLAVVATATAVGVVVRSLADHGMHLGPLLRRSVRRVLSWLRPRSAVWFPVLVARTALLAIIIPAVTCAIWWIVQHGTPGALAAARSGAWAHGARTGAAIVCFMLVTGVGDARQRRADQVRRMAAALSTGAVAAVAVAALVAAALVVTALPRADAVRLGPGGLGWIPARLRDNVDRERDEIVSAELHATTGCLSDAQDVTWQASYTARNPIDAPDVARLSVDEGVPTPGDLTTAAAAAHNQLAPWIATIELRVGDGPPVVIDRTRLSTGRPLVDPSALVAAAEPGTAVMAAGSRAFDEGTALACATAPVP
jgi:hypothetical protein